MRTLVKISVFTVLVIMFYATSCQPDDGDELIAPGNEPAKETSLGMEAKINSKDWKATNYRATINGKQIVIRGFSDSLGTITMTLLDTAVGSYYCNQTSGNYTTYSSDSNYYDLFNSYSNLKDGGIVIISRIDKDSSFVTGSFNFYVFNKKENKTYSISQGSFVKVPFTVEKAVVSGISAKTNDSITWKSSGINGIIGERFVNITGTASDSSKISFYIENNLNGIYNLSYNTAHKAIYVLNKDTFSTKFGTSTSGMINITITKDSVASGNFVFTVIKKNGDLENITEGIFNNIKLTK